MKHGVLQKFGGYAGDARVGLRAQLVHVIDAPFERSRHQMVARDILLRLRWSMRNPDTTFQK